MLNSRPLAWLGFFCLFSLLSVATVDTAPAQGKTIQQQPTNPVERNYSKKSYRIPMRDGKTLYTSVYTPRDQSKKYPFMINRTPYSVQPYGDDKYSGRIAPSKYMQSEGYIFVHQDVRGRWNSEDNYDNMRPHVPGDSAIDESSDTYDTIEWLLKNIPNNNGNAGIWGISYPGFYSAAALPEHHPALVASSPQAPISDFYFDDFHHHGAYLLSYFLATSTFGYQHDGPTQTAWYQSLTPSSRDAWNYYMSLGPMSEAGKLFDEDNFFWQQLSEHPNYDEFWQKRSILPHLKGIKTNVMTVGGLFDAEDLYGPFNIYREIEKNNPDTFNVLVMGPWSHGDWARQSDYAVVGKVAFGEKVSEFYQREVEAPFFRHFLKGTGEKPKFEALIYDTGVREWKTFEKWPPAKAQSVKHYLHGDKSLSTTPPTATEIAESSFVSDPANPVPHRDRQDIEMRFTPRPYMSDDQRFATGRPDVLAFQTQPLTESVTLTGDILAHLKVSTTGSSADWIVKLIDVYPEDHPFVAGSQPGLKFGGFQQMVRSEVIRGRFRNSYETPQPFVPNEVAEINLPLQDVCHTFKPGHRIMVHIQSSWFPLIDRNPQSYVDNIFKAKAEDFIKATHTVHHDPKAASWIELKVLKDE
ncbi:MAG: putative CocE/NonD family hydrolase [Mariniblastus sp.]|jgi:putative CocE/NonD family hydrolase